MVASNDCLLLPMTLYSTVLCKINANERKRFYHPFPKECKYYIVFDKKPKTLIDINPFPLKNKARFLCFSYSHNSLVLFLNICMILMIVILID